MSHRALDEVAELEVQLREIDANILVAMSAIVVDLTAVFAARRRRNEIVAWLKAAREACA